MSKTQHIKKIHTSKSIAPRGRNNVEDESILKSYKPLVKSISRAFGPNCEVILHSLANAPDTCIAIENGDITGRMIGSGMTAFVADILEDADSIESDTVGVYYTKTLDGRSLKSVTNIIRNSRNEVIGCLCINIDVSVPLHEFIRNFLPVVDAGLSDALSESEESPNDVDQLIHASLDTMIAEANNYRTISGSEKNRIIVRGLNNKGIFSIRGAVEIVAKQLGVSRYTIYNYIKEVSIE